MARTWRRMTSSRRHRYQRLPLHETEPLSPSKEHRSSPRRAWMWAGLFIAIAGLLLVEAVAALARPANGTNGTSACDTIQQGYRCSPNISHFWGQYSMWYPVPSEISVEPPKTCQVTWALVLSRHGARYPTSNAGSKYMTLIDKIQATATAFPDEFAFLQNYTYTLGADTLTTAGQQEMVNSGIHFHRRYAKLAAKNVPFARTTDEDRMLDSAEHWLQGYAQASKNTTVAAPNVIIPETSSENNTLSHDSCPAYDDTETTAETAEDNYQSVFGPPVQARVNQKLGTNLTLGDIKNLMDLCPFETVGSADLQVSEFCDLFTEDEWHQYDYFQSVSKYYEEGPGRYLGAAQGVGWVNELIARLTGSPVQDHTNSNSTLDTDPTTFPLNRKLYADFSHDNDMMNIYAALGLYNSTAPLSQTELQNTTQTNGFSASWTVPFAARMYVEKLQCAGADEEFVRFIVSDRVLPLEFCGGDEYGRCTLSAFVKSQTFAESGGNYDLCFANSTAATR